ncbi:hypothetical protein GCM10025868_23830 [Angustibacter aerolatus]|uniref:Beta-lactamase-related domain-containing protein n=1 Tax=Angustibacter aerolatus TaxID=1162965 RepID=A0ABQ6JG36_9ACTN|nr:hypothetical protein [Angustibacter aerolatus]GMA87133.1 hypothetical protein GCM10025868_23830 [Angustibacter aerolatus]
MLAPLGMSSTRLEGSAAHGVHGPVRDLALLGAEPWRPTLLPAPLAERMRTPAWPDLIGVVPGFGLQRPCPWGLGPEVRGHKQPHWTGAANTPATFGHFGQSGELPVGRPRGRRRAGVAVRPAVRRVGGAGLAVRGGRRPAGLV